MLTLFPSSSKAQELLDSSVSIVFMLNGDGGWICAFHPTNLPSKLKASLLEALQADIKESQALLQTVRNTPNSLSVVIDSSESPEAK